MPFVDSNAKRWAFLCGLLLVISGLTIFEQHNSAQKTQWLTERQQQHAIQQQHIDRNLRQIHQDLNYLSQRFSDLNQRPDLKSAYQHWLGLHSQYRHLLIVQPNGKAYWSLTATTEQSPFSSNLQEWQRALSTPIHQLYLTSPITPHQYTAFLPFLVQGKTWAIALTVVEPLLPTPKAWLVTEKGRIISTPFADQSAPPLPNRTDLPQIEYDHNDQGYLAQRLWTNTPIHTEHWPWWLISPLPQNTDTTKLALFVSIFLFIVTLLTQFYRQRQEEKANKRYLEDTIQRHQITLKHTIIGMIILDQQAQVRFINPNAQKWLAIHPERFQEKEDFFSQLQTPELKHTLRQLYQEAKHQNTKTEVHFQHFTFSATPYHHQHSEMLICIKNNWVWLQRNQKQACLVQALEQNDRSMLIVTRQGQIEFANRHFKACYLLEESQFSRSALYGILKKDFPDPQQRKQFLRELLQGNRITFTLERHDQYFVEKTLVPIRDDKQEKITHYIYSGKNITEQTLKKRNLYTLAHFDDVTGLPNRHWLKQHLMQQTTPFTLFKIEWRLTARWIHNVDHEDMTTLRLAYVTQLKRCLSDSHHLTKVEENRFVFLSNNTDKTQIIRFCQTLFEKLPNQLVTVTHKVVEIQHSMGVTINSDTPELAHALQQAKLALYFACQRNRSQFFLYTPKMAGDHQRHYQLIDELKNSLNTDQYALHYQPKVDAQTHRLTGMEALLRWKDSNGNTHSPLKIIELLEETQLIHPVGHHLLHQVCCQAVKWGSVRIAINISSTQLTHPDFLQTVKHILQETKCPADLLEFEITESTLMKNVHDNRKQLRLLQEMGIRIAIDDFGTGYSSLAYLNNFPFDTIKIDRIFVQALPDNRDNVTITKCIIDLAISLNKHIVVEGVETQAQVAFLSQYAINEYQGYFFNKPLSAMALEDYYQLEAGVVS